MAVYASLFGVGAPEALVIGVVALLIFGPKGLAEGASAAVNAIILLDVFLFSKNIYYVNLVIPVPAILMGAFILGSALWRITKLCGVRGGGSAAAESLFWQATKRLSFSLAFESSRERNAAIMLARSYAFDCNIMLSGPNDRPFGAT